MGEIKLPLRHWDPDEHESPIIDGDGNEVSFDAINAALSEREALRKEVEEIRPYRDALHARHNGYNDAFRAEVPECRRPKTPLEAIDSLVEEAKEWGRFESEREREALWQEARRLRDQVEKAERERDALSARLRRCEEALGRISVLDGPDMERMLEIARDALGEASDG